MRQLLKDSATHRELETRAVQFNFLLVHQLWRVSPAREILHIPLIGCRAERIEATWNELSARAEKVYHRLPKERRIAFFEVVYAPVALVTHANRMYIAGESTPRPPCRLR